MDLLFSTLESGFKYIAICWMDVDRSGIRKEKVADSKVSGYNVWMGPQSYAIQVYFVLTLCVHIIYFF